MVRVSDIVRELEPLISGAPAELTPLESVMGAEIPLQAGAVTSDSRRTVPGGVFVAIRGANVDGLDYVEQALERGVRVVISEAARPSGLEGLVDPGGLCWLQVSSARIALARVAALVFGQPSEQLALVGVTGTNGKTTITYLVESILRAAGLPAAVMGTISYRIDQEAVTAEFTTPEAAETQYFLHRAVSAGVRHAVMEVSSIGLALHRTDSLRFAVAAFTNLTQDHLDFHQTMEAYFAAKRKLFDGSLGSYPAHAVINVDDAYGRELAGSWPAEAGTLWTYGIESPARITIKPPVARSIFGLEGLRFTAVTPVGELVIESPLVGRPHASNILGAIGIGLALGLSVETITAGIRQCTGVPGRFERVSTAADDITVIVDYAHTPDALANVLRTIQSAQSGRGAGRQAGSLTTVFGCGGDRDRTKRPLMGEEAGRWSERVVITSDNPRSEDPLLIMNDIRVGVDRTETSYEMIVDRRAAILAVIADARPGEVILLAGKGHENYQILSTGRIHFDDREVAREALAERRNYPGRQLAAKPGRPAGGER
jgi:UDP-N-acetylmuramoyl-L-alanyl-D-glutamate--2,6-diaminopimelate ligase